MNTQTLIIRISSILLLSYVCSVWPSQTVSCAKVVPAVVQVSINDLLITNPALLNEILRDLLARDPLQLEPSMFSTVPGEFVFKDKITEKMFRDDLAQLKTLRAELRPVKNS